MVPFIVKRIIRIIITLFVLSFILFTAVALVNEDPLYAIYGEAYYNLSEETKDDIRHEMGYDNSIPERYFQYISQVAKGNMGISYSLKEPVSKLVIEGLKNSLSIMIASYIIIIFLCIPIGIFLTKNMGKKMYCGIRKLGLFLHSLPEFWICMVLIMVFSVNLGITPISGMYEIGNDSISSRIHHLILPVTAMILTHLGFYYNFVSDRFAEERKSMYVLGAKAKGLNDFILWYKHMLKNVMSSLITMFSVSIVHIVGGSYIVEYIFNFNGIGRLTFDAVKVGDYPVIICSTIVTSLIVMLGGLICDLTVSKIDRRIEF